MQQKGNATLRSISLISEVRRVRASALVSGLALAVRPAGAAEASGSRVTRCGPSRQRRQAALDPGGAVPDNMRRSGPRVTVTLPGDCASSVRLTAWSSRPGVKARRAGRRRGTNGLRCGPLSWGEVDRGNRVGCRRPTAGPRAFTLSQLARAPLLRLTCEAYGRLADRAGGWQAVRTIDSSKAEEAFLLPSTLAP